jgi:hypothetical protein
MSNGKAYPLTMVRSGSPSLRTSSGGLICSLVAAAESRKAEFMDRHLADRLAIRDVVETWVIARDSGDWETFHGTWHDDGYMMATWWQGPAEEFTEVSRAGWERGVNIIHFLGGCRVTIAGDRAIAQTKMTIMQRGVVHGVFCDVACTGRFWSVNVTFRAPRLAAGAPHGNAVQYWVLNPQQPGLMGRLDLDGVWWCIANGVTQETAEAHPYAIVQAMTGLPASTEADSSPGAGPGTGPGPSAGPDMPIEVLATDAWTARMQLADRYARPYVHRR